MKVEKINNGFVDPEGDVRILPDLTDEMEFVPFPSDPALHSATSGLKRVRRTVRRGGRSYPDISGREIGDAIQQALFTAETALGHELTESEAADVARHAELKARGIL